MNVKQENIHGITNVHPLQHLASPAFVNSWFGVYTSYCVRSVCVTV